jgi:Zn-dependent M28 family amino/carboxypeptidase
VGVKNGDIYNGADDDGSGTVALLEIAFSKAKKGHGPKRSILFYM